MSAVAVVLFSAGLVLMGVGLAFLLQPKAAPPPVELSPELAERIERMRAAVDVTSRVLGEALLPVVDRMVAAMNDLGQQILEIFCAEWVRLPGGEGGPCFRPKGHEGPHLTIVATKARGDG